MKQQYWKLIDYKPDLKRKEGSELGENIIIEMDSKQPTEGGGGGWVGTATRRLPKL